MSTILANAATLGYNLAATGSYTNIPVKSINTPSPEYAVTDVSGLSDAVNIKLPGYLDNKTFGFSSYHSAAVMTLLTATLPGIVAYYQITLIDNSTFTFQAIMSKPYKTKLERNGSIVYEVELDITGAITYASA